MNITSKNLTFFFLLLTIQGCQSQHKDGIEEDKYPNGKTQFMYTYRNGELNGSFKSFFENGTLWHESNYVNGRLEGTAKTYTPESKLATEEEYRSGWLYFQKIYWQPIPYDEKNFLFSSDSGFVSIKNGKSVDCDSSTPDNIIQKNLNPENGDTELYIWIDGKKSLYKKFPRQ